MKVGGTSYRSIWPDKSRRSVYIIDQTLLPFALETRELDSADAVAEAIRTMRVRGAPLIGVAAAFGLALAIDADASAASVERAAAMLKATRPTAVNLAWAVDALVRHVESLPHQERASAAWGFAHRLADQDAATNAAIGEHGADLIAALHGRLGRTVNLLTHCNAGWIATVDWGTALAAVYKAHDRGIPVHVWVDETRPRNQGLLTAWELRGHGVPHTYIVDNAGGHLMQHGKVDVVMVGADRVSTAGDVANKIGTYLKALAAHDNGIPFYAAVPMSTIDPALAEAGRDIEIEERDGGEVRSIAGLARRPGDKPQTRRGVPGENAPISAPIHEFVHVDILDPATPVGNPAFDVTPARLVSGIITERGVFAPGALATALTATAP